MYFRDALLALDCFKFLVLKLGICMKVAVTGLLFVYQIDITDCYQVSVASQQDKL
jgi:hypothetical protein